MAKQTVQIEGLSELLARLKALPPAIASKRGGPVRQALAAATKLARQEITNIAPISEGKPTSGRLRRNIIMIRSKDPQRYGLNEEYLITVRRGPRGGRASAARTRRLEAKGIARRDDPRDAYYARFLEFGTKFLRARSFFRLGFEARKNDSLQLFKTRLDRSIVLAVRRLGGK